MVAAELLVIWSASCLEGGGHAMYLPLRMPSSHVRCKRPRVTSIGRATNRTPRDGTLSTMCFIPFTIAQPMQLQPREHQA